MIVAATGHRPDKLGGYGLGPQMGLMALAIGYIRRTPGIQLGISGMALGWDMAWAEALTTMEIPFIAAVPFKGQDKVWPPNLRKRYADLLKCAVRIEIVSPGGYSPEKMQRRNEWMMIHSDRVVALWNGSRGGTANCLEIADLMAKPIDNLWSEWEAS